MIQYPPKPWQDGDIFRHTASDGTELIGVYEAQKNTWTFTRADEEGSIGGDLVTTADVKSLNVRPTDTSNPFDLSNNPADVRTQQEVNWWFYEHLGARFPIFSDNPPTLHPDYEAPDNILKLGDIWIKESDKQVYVFNGLSWDEVRARPKAYTRDTAPNHLSLIHI